MRVHVIKAPAGLGKTSMLIEKFAASPDKRIEFYVPTLNLAREVEAQFTARDVSVQVIRGRTQEVEGGETMCKKPQLAQQVSDLGYPVFPVLCMGAAIPGDKYSIKRCEYYDDCAYLKQFQSEAKVFVYTHAYLPLPRNSFETVVPDAVVIDESFLADGLKITTVDRAQVEAEAKDDIALQCFAGKFFDVIDCGEELLLGLRKRGLSDAVMEELRSQYAAPRGAFLKSASDAEALKFLRAKVKPKSQVDLLLTILADELTTDRAASHGVTYDAPSLKLTLHYRRPFTRFDAMSGSSKAILIDANADPDLIREWFPAASFEKITVKRKAYVVQCSSARGSTISFVPDKHTDADSKRWAEKNLAGLQELVDREARGGARKVLVVGPQVITGNPAKNVATMLSAPRGGALEHFNALRGVDKYKDFDTVIIVGRNQPPLDALEADARALWYDSATPLQFAKDFAVETRPYRFRDSSKAMGVEVLVHPDQRIQRLHEQKREGESTQAIDRLRLVHAVQEKRVVVVSNMPLELEVDELLDLQTLLYRSRLTIAWEQLHGVMPLNPAWLSGQFPELWPTAGAARTDLRVRGKSGHSFNGIDIRTLTTLDFQYRVAGQPRHSAALSVLSVPETMNELARLLGVPVAVRSVSGGVPSPEGAAAMLKVVLAPLTAHGTAGPQSINQQTEIRRTA